MGSLVKINWATDSDKSSWYGVTCNNDKEVVEIRIFQSLMFGLFPPEVELLADTLQVLDLRENYLLTTEFDVGNRWLAKMTKLRMLLVGRTSFECPIPWYLNSTVALEELDISNTYYMEGPIRAWAEAFEGWNKLRYDVDTSSSNVYTSTVPTAISNLPNLEFFYLNNVSGVTQSLGFLLSIPEIIECWVDNTEMEGGILSDLPSTLACCLSGSLPTGLENLKVVNRMWLNQNGLTGTIPTELGQLENIEHLFLGGNRLQGEIPQNLGGDCDAGVTCRCCSCCDTDQCESQYDWTEWSWQDWRTKLDFHVHSVDNTHDNLKVHSWL